MQALRILKEVVAVSGAALPAVQEAGGIAAAISVLDSGTGNGAGANSGGADTTHPAQEVSISFDNIECIACAVCKNVSLSTPQAAWT